MTAPYRTRRRTQAAADRRSRAPRRPTRSSATSGSRPAAAAPGPAFAQATRLAAALAALARGLPNPWDESDDDFRGFAALLPADVALGAESFRTALGIGARYRIDLSPAAKALAALGNPDDWGEDIAGGFRQLAQVMRATLGELSLAFARGTGVVRVRVWLFGRAAEGTLVGLRSIGTET